MHSRQMIDWFGARRRRGLERRQFWVKAHGDDYWDLYLGVDWSELVKFVADRQADADRMRSRLGADAVWEGTVVHPSPCEPASTCEIEVKVVDVGTCAVATLTTATDATPDALVVVPDWRGEVCKLEGINQHLQFVPLSERKKLTTAMVTALSESRSHLVVTLPGKPDDLAYQDFKLVLARAVLGWLSDRDFPEAANSPSGRV